MRLILAIVFCFNFTVNAQSRSSGSGSSGGSGTVTSVGLTVPTFLSVSGSPVTTAGVLAVTLSGTALPIANGGTGQTTAPLAINALVPTQATHSGEFLTTNGTVVSWSAAAGGANTALSNLITTNINKDFIFNTGAQATIQTVNNPGATSENLSLVTGTGDSTGVLFLGTANGSSTSGNINYYTGNAAGGNSGGHVFTTGPATGGNSGGFLVTTGTANGSNNTGGIGLGVSGPVDGAGGDIELLIGAPSGSGTRGSIYLRAFSTVVNASTAGGLFLGEGSGLVPLRLYDLDGDKYAGFKSPSAVTTSVTYELPVADGTSGQVLSTNASGVLSWVTKGAGSVTSVAATVPAFLSIAGSPVTTTGTLAISLSGTALPIANGGTSGTTKAGAFDALSPMTTGGDVIYGGASGTGTRLANGTSGQVLTSAGGTSAPTWSLPGVFTIGAKTGNYTIAATDQVITVDTTGGAFNLTLPTPSTVSGRMFRIKDVGGTLSTNNLTVVRAGSETIEGVAASLILSANRGEYTLMSDGTNWIKVGSNSNRASKTFAASSSWVAPAGVYNVIVYARGGAGGPGGGGGGGGGSTTTAARGGGAGGAGGSVISRSLPATVVPNTSYTVTIGAAGAAGASGAGAVANAAGAAGTDGGAGTTGGSTTFGSLLTYFGGGPGGAGVAGALAVTGTGGGAGTTREITAGAGGAGAVAGSAGATGGAGANSFFGTRNSGGVGGTSGASQGGGGGGAAAVSAGDTSITGTAGTGGNGGNAADGGAGGTAQDTSALAGAGGGSGGGGGGGGIIAVTGSNGGAGAAGAVGSVGTLTVIWNE